MFDLERASGRGWKSNFIITLDIHIRKWFRRIVYFYILTATIEILEFMVKSYTTIITEKSDDKMYKLSYLSFTIVFTVS